MSDTLDGEDPLVTLESYDGPPRAAARELIDSAREVDEDMSFGPPGKWSTPSATSTVEIRTGLHRWTIRTADSSRLAGVITVRPGESARVVDLLIAPEYRSTGVATAAIECALAEGRLAPPSSTSEPVVACAYGSHPAALRLTRRFGAARSAERHHMVLSAQSAYRPPTEQAAPVTRSDDQWRVLAERLDDDIVDGVGVIDLTDNSSGHTADAIHRTLIQLFAAGAASIEATVDACDEDLIDLLRSAAFGHDRTDVLIHCDARNLP
ncbi:hypothetical protein L5I01_01650 [Gordonia sp. HY442]|uniref:hypothetical protein n=1 Tax=Gordonia zhenghanii TaxID=2911516 RepID=UPI001F16665C|nr:hypothetical protein [Gordonia zhenghanii]MCF8601988.1 hypothetical protein [Gordonia zhenghanii]MCF8602056.1 hypothetical protein [Gordonia zhenghanii]